MENAVLPVWVCIVRQLETGKTHEIYVSYRFSERSDSIRVPSMDVVIHAFLLSKYSRRMSIEERFAWNAESERKALCCHSRLPSSAIRVSIILRHPTCNSHLTASGSTNTPTMFSLVRSRLIGTSSSLTARNVVPCCCGTFAAPSTSSQGQFSSQLQSTRLFSATSTDLAKVKMKTHVG